MSRLWKSLTSTSCNIQRIIIDDDAAIPMVKSTFNKNRQNKNIRKQIPNLLDNFYHQFLTQMKTKKDPKGLITQDTIML